MSFKYFPGNSPCQLSTGNMSTSSSQELQSEDHEKNNAEEQELQSEDQEKNNAEEEELQSEDEEKYNAEEQELQSEDQEKNNAEEQAEEGKKGGKPSKTTAGTKEVTVLPKSKPNTANGCTHITHSEKAAENCLPLKIVVNIDTEKRPQKSYYDTCCCKRGLLFTLQFGDPKWDKSNKKDKKALDDFFGNTLNFSVNERKNYDALVGELKAGKYDGSLYNCLWIFISCHGSEKGATIGNVRKTTHEIAADFSNANIAKMSGVPKIIIIDTCRGKKDNESIKKSDKDVLPTTDSDCLVINATTYGHYANIPDDKGSVGLQGVMDSLTANWENDHLEEMLIDARMNVARWGHAKERQILEIQSTFLKRLKLTKYVQR